MRHFVVDDTFWELFPSARLAVLILNGINNTAQNDPAIAQALAEAHEIAPSHVPEPQWIDNPLVSRWRGAFQRFKTKKGARSSIEALLKRVNNGGTIGSINPLVDIYNAISLRYGVPIGGEDLDTVKGDIHLKLAQGGEPFLPLGAASDDPALPGELIYADDVGAICRCWNWREASRTQLTEQTTRAVMVLEAVDDTTDAALAQAAETLAHAITSYLGGQVRSHMVRRGAPPIPLD